MKMYIYVVIIFEIKIKKKTSKQKKHQWIFTKLGMGIDIVAILFRIASGQISSKFDRVICLRHAHIFVSRW